MPGGAGGCLPADAPAPRKDNNSAAKFANDKHGKKKRRNKCKIK